VEGVEEHAPTPRRLRQLSSVTIFVVTDDRVAQHLRKMDADLVSPACMNSHAEEGEGLVDVIPQHCDLSPGGVRLSCT